MRGYLISLKQYMERHTIIQKYNFCWDFSIISCHATTLGNGN